MKRAVPLLALATLTAGTLAVNGQNYSSSVSLPNVSSITTYNGAPEGFDPVSAADSQLEDYGFPRRPDPGDVKAYANWVQAVSTTRITPQLLGQPECGPSGEPAGRRRDCGVKQQHGEDRFIELERIFADCGRSALS